MQSVFYYEKERMEILPFCRQVETGSFHIIDKGMLHAYSTYRESSDGMINPVRVSCDPFGNEGADKISDYVFTTHMEFELQKIRYLLVLPIRPHL